MNPEYAKIMAMPIEDKLKELYQILSSSGMTIQTKETRPMSNEHNTIWIDEYCGNRFDNREDAIKSAKRNAFAAKQDVAIWRQDPVAVVRFPEPDLVVEEIVSAAA